MTNCCQVIIRNPQKSRKITAINTNISGYILSIQLHLPCNAANNQILRSTTSEKLWHVVSWADAVAKLLSILQQTRLQFTAEFAETAVTRGTLAAPVHVTGRTMTQLAYTGPSGSITLRTNLSQTTQKCSCTDRHTTSHDYFKFQVLQFYFGND